MSAEVPEGWVSTTLGETCVVKARIGWRGLSASEYASDGPFLIAGKHINNGKIDWDACDHLTEARYAESPEIQLQKGDSIFSKDGSIGNPAFIETLPGKATINGTMMLLRPNAIGLDEEFLYQFICGAAFSKMVEEKVSGSSIPHIFQRDIVHFPFLLPPVGEQRRIAETLRSVDRDIELTQRTLAAARAAKNATLISALSKRWPEATVGSLLASTPFPMRSGPFGSALLKAELEAEGIPLLGIDNVQVERFVPVYRRFVSEEKYRELARYTVFPNDVMVTIMGTVGRCCVVPPDVGTAISSKHVWTITLDQNRYSPALLAWQINYAPWVLEQLRGSAQGGIMAAISSATLRSLRVPMPPPSDLREIEGLLLASNSAISTLEADLDQAERLKSALSADLLSGRVRVPATTIDAAEPLGRTVQPAFKRAVLAAEIVHQLHKDAKFGSVKHEKIVHLCELHAGLHEDLDRHAYKEAAGPYDPRARRSVETTFRNQKWFSTQKSDRRVEYVPLERCGSHRHYYERYFGARHASIQNIIDLLRPMNREQCEIVATLYAVWNDFLLDGKTPSDQQIVQSVLNNWHPSKRAIAEDRWLIALRWMRAKGLVPTGVGEKTRVAAS